VVLHVNIEQGTVGPISSFELCYFNNLLMVGAFLTDDVWKYIREICTPVSFQANDRFCSRAYREFLALHSGTMMQTHHHAFLCIGAAFWNKFPIKICNFPKRQPKKCFQLI